jgi:uncharacterized protein DUF4145
MAAKIVELREEHQNVAFCPHCGNRAPQRLLLKYDYEHPYSLTVEEDGNSYSEKVGSSSYFVAACTTCEELLLYNHYRHQVGVENFTHADLLYPEGIELDRSVPDKVRACYAEAARIRKTAPNAYAVMIRRALEALCEDRGTKEGTLQSGLSELATRGEIPALLLEVTAVLRIIGNTGAHHSDKAIPLDLIWLADELFRAVLGYVYIAPSRLASFRQRLETAVKR